MFLSPAMEGHSSIISKLNYPQIGLLIIAWFVVDLLTPLVIRLCHAVGAVDRPHTYKTHKVPMPILGGLCIFIGLSLAIFSLLRFTSMEENAPLFAILLGGFMVLVVGSIDDLKPLWAVAKLFMIFLVTLLLYRFNVRIQLTGIVFLDVGLTLLWIVGVTSAINSLDNMDGAAIGVSAVAAFWTFYIAWHWEPYGQPGVTYVAIALFGASLGFLRYNFPPARIFLGDNGSLLLGFLLASLMVMTGWARNDPVRAIIIPCAVLVVPLYDITLSTILRIKNGVVKGVVEAIVYCGKDHLSHRLVALGLSRREAVMMLYLLGMISGTIGAIIAREEVPFRVYMAVTCVSLAILVALGMLLDKAKVYEFQKSPDPSKEGENGGEGDPDKEEG